MNLHFFSLICILSFALVATSTLGQSEDVCRLYATEAQFNSTTTAVVADDRLERGRGLSLKPGIYAAIDGERQEPDLVVDVRVPQPGRYLIHTHAVTDEEGAKAMQAARSKFESLFIRIQIDDRRPTKRVVYVPWNVARQESGKFELEGAHEIKIWLPRGVIFDYMELSPYTPPTAPAAAENYSPKIVPPSSHPRLWVNEASLPVIKARLTSEENREAWNEVKEAALKPFAFDFNPDAEMLYNADLERAAELKAFHHLMTGDTTTGKEAIRLMRDYLSVVEFGNILDITREIGRAIYTASLVYDWCYDLLTPDDKAIFLKHLARLADEMEIGWPPFKESIVNGHANEAQVNRDLLAMSIAIYDENPEPYKYTSYLILEVLVPMRAFEYQSPRHNQGVAYAAYRFGWEMHAAWLFYRMTGKPVFHDNIKDVRKFFLYMRLPNGEMLRDGDGFGSGQPGKPYYWSAGQTTLLNYAYANDPIVKGEFRRQGGLKNNPVLFLLLNDPELKTEESLESLPLTLDFGPVLGGMVARTGWNMGDDSNDVVAEIKGGGYHFANHQHSDAGSLQVYYRGLQFGDIGIYKFYGTPYDFNFNKRSVAHSMMLAFDPNEKNVHPKADGNDGGTRFNQRFPKSPEEVQNNPLFFNGKVVSADYGPDTLKPSFSYFGVDLTSAYTDKLKAYTRNFSFLNLKRDDVPAAIILTDDMTTADPSFKKYWQINPLNPPEQTADGVVLHNQRGNLVGKAHVQMIAPAPGERDIHILSGTDTYNVFGRQYEPPDSHAQEVRGHRIMISPRNANTRDRFLTVFQFTADYTAPLPVKHIETKVSDVIIIHNRVVSMSNTGTLIDEAFSFKIPKGERYQVVLAGLKEGTWEVRVGKQARTHAVAPGKNTIYLEATGGRVEARKVGDR